MGVPWAPLTLALCLLQHAVGDATNERMEPHTRSYGTGFTHVHQGDVVPTEGWWLGRPRPYFAHVPSNISVISGHTAYLPCRVHMLGDRSVTWMRGRDLHILTVGVITYSADERFQVVHSRATDDWTLQVQYSQPRDSGIYKCQVNSDPKIVRNVSLSVIDKRFLDGHLYKLPDLDSEHGGYGTHIVGARERFLQEGSALSLECVVSHTRAPPTAVLWYHNTNVLDYDSPRGGIAIQVEKSTGQTTSLLLLSSMSHRDSGNYTCVPVNAPTAAVSVHVNADELRAAVHQGGLSGGSRPSAWAPQGLPGVLLVTLALVTSHWASFVTSYRAFCWASYSSSSRVQTS